MKKEIIMIGMSVLLICVGISGCEEKTGVLTSTKPAVNINTFTSATEGELIRFYFLLEDEDGVNTYCDGHIKLDIFDGADNLLFNEEFDVKSSEFVDYEFKLTGTDIGKAYEWRVQIKDIEKGAPSFGFGKAVLTFLTPEYKTLYDENPLIQIPTYTEEELGEMYEAEYEESAISVNKKISKGSFEVTMTRVGFFNKYEWTETKQYFRVDMEVRNIGSDSEYFLPSGLAIIDSQNNQYEQSYLGTLNTFSTVYPGATINGYLLFENVPTPVTSIKLVFKLGYDEYFNSYLFEYNINLK